MSEDEGEKVTDLIIPLNKSVCDKPQTKEKEDIQRKENSTVIGDSLNKNSLEETAVREILEDVKTFTEAVENSNTLTLQIQKSRHGIGESKESTLDDYESIPVVDYGMAMLKGMGWNPGKGIGKKGRIVTANMPQPRPRGMGLGADKVDSSCAPSTLAQDEGEELKVIKGASVQVISGSHKGQYGQIEGFNEDSGRVIVRLSLHSSSVTVNENAFKLVTKEEYTKNSRVLNVSKYQEYTQKTDENLEVVRQNMHHAEKRHHKSQSPKNHPRQRLK
ncbi:G patch domain and KOW motifs-containing protein isoform X2 [Zootermopsis nevadensis]|uniref:G patch domain and KOW motifs-containing protein isoform X2 n=1 Tax=Zootermopsis nevadensis TaxID=136037 RepID=UPI000B8E3947|nr:G patch domain and KOW motifs-containing protein isoform X2 [Zootermopsis nevadensis]